MSTLSHTYNARSREEKLTFLPINNVDCVHPGGYEGLVSPDNFKRAVQLRPPTVFTVEVLDPDSSDGGHDPYMVRMRIAPASLSSSTSSSPAASSAASAYTSMVQTPCIIHRNWSDCLHLLSSLASQYSFLARLKKDKLKKGQGGLSLNAESSSSPSSSSATPDSPIIYNMRDSGASFDSLPPGPNPSSIHLDLFDALPSLPRLSPTPVTMSATATLFSPKRRKERKDRERDERRRLTAEWQRFLQELFRDDEEFDPKSPMPKLLEELREQRQVTDFFGMWMRDVKRSDSVDTDELRESGSREVVKVLTREARLRRRNSGASGASTPATKRSSYYAPSMTTNKTGRRRSNTLPTLLSAIASPPSSSTSPSARRPPSPPSMAPFDPTQLHKQPKRKDAAVTMWILDNKHATSEADHSHEPPSSYPISPCSASSSSSSEGSCADSSRKSMSSATSVESTQSTLTPAKALLPLPPPAIPPRSAARIALPQNFTLKAMLVEQPASIPHSEDPTAVLLRLPSSMCLDKTLVEERLCAKVLSVLDDSEDLIEQYQLSLVDVASPEEWRKVLRASGGGKITVKVALHVVQF